MLESTRVYHVFVTLFDGGQSVTLGSLPVIALRNVSLQTPCEIREECPFVARTFVLLYTSREIRFEIHAKSNDFAQTAFNRFDLVLRDTRLIAASIAWSYYFVNFGLARTSSTHLICGLR